MSKVAVRVILKSGADFTVECDEFKVRKFGSGDLAGYNIEGIKTGRPLFIDVEQISAIVQVK